jgi:peptide/nickel transport system substrate-binding protein
MKKQAGNESPRKFLTKVGGVKRSVVLFSCALCLMSFVDGEVFGASGVLTVCDDVADPKTLDPQKQFTEKNRTILQHIFEELVRINPEGKLEPHLAQSWERLTPLTVRFHLRPSVKFHNGEDFSAEAVRFSIQRYLDPNTGFPGAPFISSISSATVVDPLTVDVHTHYPDGLLLHRIASIILIVPPKYVSESAPDVLEKLPVGTGPFKFEHWEKGREVVLVANDSYWKMGVPKVKELHFRFLSSAQQVEALMQGKIDLLTEMPGTWTLKAKENPKTDVLKRASFYTVVGLFNTAKGPLSDVRVRKAINFAINREELIRYDLLGNGITLASITMPGEIGHNSSLVPYPFDLQKARALLKEAGYDKGFELKTLLRAQGERTAGIIAKQLEAIGIKIVNKTVSSDGEVIEAFQKGVWDLGIAALPDPMAHSFFIQSIVLYSKSPFSLQKDSIYDSKLEQMASEIDPKQQEILAKSLDKYVYDNALCIFTYQRIKTYGISRRLKFSPYVTGVHYFDNAEIIP